MRKNIWQNLAESGRIWQNLARGVYMFDVQKILSLPESKTVEFKRDLSSMNPVLKTLVAFANTAGGVLLIGRDNDGTIVGIDDVFAAEEKLANTLADSIVPQLLAEIEIASIEGKSLLVVRVAHWRGPFYLKAKGPEQGVYIRLGSTNRLAGPEQIAELKRSIANVSFDQIPCPEVDISGLDMQRIHRAFSEVGRKVDKNKLETLGVIVPYAGKLVCSNGGVLLFGQDSIRKKYFPNTVFRCARFQGTEKVHFIDHYDVEATIIEAMGEVPKFIRRNTRMAAKIQRIKLEDIPEYSSVAVREALTNALVHADYSIQGMNPRLAIFSDRLEIESPGMLPFGYTLEDFVAGISHIRNKVIARVFRELHLMEEWGTGYRRIIESCQKGGYPEPVWAEIGTSVRVILYPQSTTTEIFEPIPKRIEQQQLTLSQREILNVFKHHELLSAKEIRNKLQDHRMAERTIRALLQELKALGLLVMVGRGRATSWMKQ